MTTLTRHMRSQHNGLDNVEEERVGPPVFPAHVMTDDDQVEMEKKYTAIAYDLFSHEPEALRKYVESSATIFDHRIVGSHSKRVADCCVVKTFNLALTPRDTSESDAISEEIVQKFEDAVVPLINYQYKLAVQIGGILNHMSEDGEVERTEYCYPSTNTSLILPDIVTNNRLLTIERRDEVVGQLHEALANRDLTEAITRGAAREDTKTVLVFFTNVLFKVFKMVDAFVGSNDYDDVVRSESLPVTENVVPVMPHYVERMRSLKDHGSENNDCMWRMLLSRLPGKRSTKQLAEEFVVYRANLGIMKPTADEFLRKGVNIFNRVKLQKKKKKWFQHWKCDMEEIVAQLEHCFDININLYYLDQDNLDYIEKKRAQPNKEFVAENLCVRAAHVSCGQHGKRTKNTTRLNALVGRNSDNADTFHVYEIKKIHKFVSQFRCSYCRLTFKRQRLLKRHMATKSCLSRYIYNGGVYQRNKNIWELLDEVDIDYTDVDITCDKRVTWDIEAKAVDLETLWATAKTTVRQKHIPVSIALKSNVPSFDRETYYRYGEDPKELFIWFYELLRKMQEKTEVLWHERMKPVYARIEQRIIEMGGVVKIPESRWTEMTTEMQEMLKRNSHNEFQETLYKHSPDVDIPLKEARCPTSQRSTPLTQVTPITNNKTLDNAAELNRFMPSKYLLDESKGGGENDDFEE